MVDQQLQFTQPRLLGSRRVEQRLAQRGSGDGKRVDRVRTCPAPARDAARGRSTGAGTRTSRCRCCCSVRSRPRVTCRQSSSAQGAAGQPASPNRQSSTVSLVSSASSCRPTSSTATAETEWPGTSTPIHDHGPRLLPLGATGERTGLNRGKAAKLLSGHARRSRRRRRHNTGSQPTSDDRVRKSAAATPSLCPTTDSTRRE